jgi:ribose-phosphate pyrophosphokinase
VSGTATSSKKLMLVSGRAYPELAAEVGACLGIEPTPTKLYDFANGEIFVRFLDSVRGCDVFVLQSHTSPINEWIMEHLIMVDALKRASAKRITVVTPFFGYARQDKKSRGREPISARLMADLFATAGADRLMAVDLHTAQIQGFFDGPVDHLFALPILAGYIENKLDLGQVTVVAPDAGRVRMCERWTDRLGCPLAIIHKRRDPEVANQVRVFEVVGEVAGRTCIVVDDMIDTGSTIAKAADALFDQGAARVIVTATHGVLSGPALDILKNSRISEVVVTNTLPIPPERQFDKLTVLSIAPLIARAINEVFSDGSVTSLFDGQSLPAPAGTGLVWPVPRGVAAVPAPADATETTATCDPPACGAHLLPVPSSRLLCGGPPAPCPRLHGRPLWEAARDAHAPSVAGHLFAWTAPLLRSPASRASLTSQGLTPHRASHPIWNLSRSCQWVVARELSRDCAANEPVKRSFFSGASCPSGGAGGSGSRHMRPGLPGRFTYRLIHD